MRAVLTRGPSTGWAAEISCVAPVWRSTFPHDVTRDGIPIELTATEFQLLAALARHPGRVFTRGQLLDAVRGSEVESFERAIDAHIKNIRRKLEPDSRQPAIHA